MNDPIFHAFYVIAITAEAMTAALIAGRRQMDWVGVCILGAVTALGGGSLRDVLLGNYPLIWVANPGYLLVTVAAALGTVMISRCMHRLRSVFLLLDAIGLVLFTILGCDVALRLEMSPVIIIVAGMITGCAGGVLRDILCTEIPLLFRRELYASVSIVTGAIYLIGLNLSLPGTAAMLTAMGVGLSMRLLALRFNLNMPRFIYSQEKKN